MARIASVSHLTLLTALCERKGWRVGLTQRGEDEWQLAVRDLRQSRDLVAAIAFAFSETTIDRAAEELVYTLARAGLVNSEAA